ncbi:TlpA family protein disulfide reductase [Gemmatimonas sp.]|uniref:TlpA family protein disulfide reductase n=1 Tax=Gemmatimonas sp. TaxID=1962908 RepID=UPI003F70F8D9
MAGRVQLAEAETRTRPLNRRAYVAGSIWPLCAKVFGSLLGMLAIVAVASDDRPPPLDVGKAMPPVRVKLLSDFTRPVSLDAHRGRVVLLSVWATWCGSCSSALAEQASLLRQFGDSGLHAVALSVDVPADSAEARAKLARIAPLVEGWMDIDRAAKSSLRYWGVPQSYIIGRDGKLAAQVSGITAAHGDVWRTKRGMKLIREALAQR